MPPTEEPALRLPRRIERIETDKMLDRGLQVLRDFRSEVDNFRKDYESRMNSVLEPGAGLFPFYQAQGFGFQGGGPFQDTQALPYTLANANSYFPITQQWTLLGQSYMSQGLIRTIVDCVVDDGFGGGVLFKSKQLKPEELDQLNRSFRMQREQASYMGTRMQRVNYSAGVDLSASDADACKDVGRWGRLFGGSGLITNTDQMMTAELNPQWINEDSPLTFIAADRWELCLDQQNISSSTNPNPYNYYGNPLNRSRVSRFVWAHAPARIRQILQGWGMSVLEECLSPVNAYLKMRKVLFELMDEAKVDVYKIKGFNANLATRRGTDALAQRVQVANQAKNFQNALTMDSEDEYEQKNLGGLFPGLSAIYEQLRIDLSAYCKIPQNKLFGQSAGGFASGKDSLDNYQATVRNFRTCETPVVTRAGGLRCQQLHGMIPDDLEVEWPALGELDGKEQEDVKTAQQGRITERFTLGLTTGPEAMAEMRKAKLIDIDPTEVELGVRDAAPPLSENPEEAEAGRDHEKDMATAAAKAKPKPGAKK